MKANELRNLFLNYFEANGHKIIQSASLLPENDPTVLFTTAGMHPLVPYLLGEPHPYGRRLTNFQKCVRTGDIDEVGDDSHLTFFEMLGNWSLGEYFKNDAITMSYEFLTDVLHIPTNKLAVTVFEGDETFVKDTESAEIWQKNGLNKDQIYYYGRKENWWGPVGETGPCGPDTEIFFDTGKPKCSNNCGPSCSCGKYIEIWNNVFMQYYKNKDGSIHLLPQKNVDTGMGLERVLAILNSDNSIYDTELFAPLLSEINNILTQNATNMNIREKRIICDHIRTATFILGDDRKILPSNSEQGYVLRRIIRRIIRLLKKANINENVLPFLAEVVINQYQDVYSELNINKSFIIEQLKKEYLLFTKTLDAGIKKAESYFDKLEEGDILSGELAFKLYDTYGFPIEFTKELAKEKGIDVDMDSFYLKSQEHQNKSRLNAGDKFKGGLSDNSVETTNLHTATHLLHSTLRKILGEEVVQRGSNITPERLRFDFSFHRKLTQEELDEISTIVNEAIQKKIDIVCEEMTVHEAKDSGAIGLFGDKYHELVKVYTISGYSKEICGGPHASNTNDLGEFKIIKEESSSAGVRRIKAKLVKKGDRER